METNAQLQNRVSSEAYSCAVVNRRAAMAPEGAQSVGASEKGAEPLAPSQLSADEGDLIARAAAGDRGAFEGLYRCHVDRIYGLCLRMTGDVARAEEATQEVFVRAWRKLSQFRGDSALSSWLYRMAVNEIFGAQRSRRRRHDRVVPVPDLTAMDAEAPAAVPSAAGIDLRRGVAQLPEQARRVFLLHDVEGYRHRDIARVLGISEGTSKSTLHRARKMLREVLS